MAEYLGSESELPQDEFIPAVTNSIVQTNQNIAEARPVNNDQNPDKFSELTPLVFYHILSFLGVNDLARLCIVSARCRERCISNPDILFDVNLDVESCTSKCRGLRNLLDKLLDVHARESGFLQMNLFRLHWHCQECQDFSPTSVFHKWVKRAVVCNAHEIDIRFFPGQVDFILPDCLGRASATILRLNLQGGQLNCNPKDDFPSIEVLSMSSIRVPRSVGEWISSHFASLKTLKLENIRLRESFSITSSSLECLTISHCLIGPGVDKCNICNIKCASLNRLLVHYSRFQLVGLYITCPSLKDLQITKCSNVTFASTKISAEALCTLSIDMTFFTSQRGMFTIIPQSLQNLERFTLKLELHDQLHDESDEFRDSLRLTKCLLSLRGSLDYINELVIDIGTVGILILKEVEIWLPKLHHLEVTIDDLQELHVSFFRYLVRSMDRYSIVFSGYS